VLVYDTPQCILVGNSKSRVEGAPDVSLVAFSEVGYKYTPIKIPEAPKVLSRTENICALSFLDTLRVLFIFMLTIFAL